MAPQPYYEDIREGQELPPLVKRPTTQQLVMYACASGDLYQIHYDQDFARSQGLPGVIIHGALKNAFLGQMVTDWMGEEGTLKQLSVQYREIDVPGDVLTCRGRVEEKRAEGHLVRCVLWLENGRGVRTTQGEALVSLPTRAG